MRLFRNVLSALLVAVLGLGVAATVPTAAVAASEPKRLIEEEDPNDNRVGFNAFKLKGVITQAVLDPLTGQPAIDPLTGLETYVPYADGKVKLQKKKCKKCSWKNVKKLRTNDSGKFKTRIYAPRQGRWKWRVYVKASDGYGTTIGKRWTAAFR
ncbi:hypothetical protein EXE58_05040 [Nocardioides seonyuensis]|uniref:Uncharacterized protein n=1 Tax=Nocardioides seonyuensis TaxID=2518371 RepID=A0A4P7IDW6_9ACTN|nr:hypothetical protein [Nocardioides seonyuensis]QBX54890.1 hypothetical protein EXE58_05040 [Nocardioides seonyuensis]